MQHIVTGLRDVTMTYVALMANNGFSQMGESFRARKLQA